VARDTPSALAIWVALSPLIDGVSHSVQRIVTSTRNRMVALVQLDRPLDTPALRVGHPALVRVCDPVYAVDVRPDGSPVVVVAGLVQRLEAFSDQQLRVLRVELPVTAAQRRDLALFNAAGEAVALLLGAAEGAEHDTAFALALDGIGDLLRGRGSLDPNAPSHGSP
jgi:molecular chaperone DnaK